MKKGNTIMQYYSVPGPRPPPGPPPGRPPGPPPAEQYDPFAPHYAGSAEVAAEQQTNALLKQQLNDLWAENDRIRQLCSVAQAVVAAAKRELDQLNAEGSNLKLLVEQANALLDGLRTEHAAAMRELRVLAR